MIRNCPKCSYARKATDAQVPDWQCPKCGIAYVKFLEQNEVSAAPRAPVLSTPAAAPMSAKAPFFILAGLVAVAYFGYQRYMAPPETEDAGGPQILEASNPAYYGTMEPGGPVLRMKPETQAKLSALTPSQVVMFATAWCPYCADARALFNAKGVRYIEFDLESDATAKAFQRDVMGFSGFPTIIIGNRVTQGFNKGKILASLKEL